MMKFVCLLAIIGAASAAESDGKTAAPTNGCYCGKTGALTAATRFCATNLDATGAGTISAGIVPFCTGAQTTGTDAAPAGNCLCGSNMLTTTAAEYCFVKNDLTGYAKTATAIKACTTAESDGKTAAPTNGCYCGKTGALTAATRFCATNLDATGDGILSAGTVPFCAGAQATGTAVSPSGNCLCGSNKAVITAGQYCFVKADFTGHTQTVAAIKACTPEKVAWGSAARTSLVTGAAGGNLVVTFTPSTTVTAGTVTITPSVALFLASAVTTCTATSDGTAQTVTAATVGNILTVTLATAQTLTAGKVAVITCTDNTAVNTAAGAVTFSIATSRDSGVLAAQIGYTITAAPSTATSNATNSTTTPTKAGTASGDDDTVITIKQVATLGIDKADYKNLVQQLTERAMSKTLGACSGNCTSLTTGYTMASAAARRASCTVTFTVVVPDADASKAVLAKGKAITAATFKTAMDDLKAADTAYAAVTPPPVKTVVAPTGGAVAASASTTTVGIFSALCLAVAALRQ